MLLHPHPLYGGNMDNSIITSLEKLFLDAGFTTFRFNFRGACKSPNSFEGIHGATLDTLRASETIQNLNYILYGIVGYSFGGSTALRFAVSNSLFFLITLSASLDLFTESGYKKSKLSAINCPVLMFHGTSDRMVPITDMDAMAIQIGQKAKTVLLHNEDHFYLHSMQIVLDEVSRFISDF